MSEAGMSNKDIIKASTSAAAEAIGISNLIGSVQPGKEADLIIVDKDPLQDIKALRTMSLIMKSGEKIVSSSL